MEDIQISGFAEPQPVITKQSLSPQQQPAVSNQSLSPQQQDLQEALRLSDTIVRMKYLSQLEKADIIPLKEQDGQASCAERVKLMHLSCITYDAEEDIANKLSGVFSAISEYDATAVFIVKHDGEKTDVYMGTACDNPEAVNASFNTLQRAINGNFPGCSMKNLFTRNNEVLLNELMSNDSLAIAAISADGSVRGEQEAGAYIQGMEKLVDGMRGYPFYLIVLASAMSAETIANLRNGYEMLYTQLAPFYKIQQSLSDTDTLSTSKTEGSSTSDTLTNTTGSSVNKTVSEGNTSTKTRSKEEDNDKLRLLEVGSQIASVAGMLALGGKGAQVAAGLWQGSLMGNSISKTLQNVFDLKQVQVSDAESRNTSVSDTTATHEDNSHSTSDTKSTNTTMGDSRSAGTATQYSYENRVIGSILSAIDSHIDKLNLCEGTGAYQCAAYLMAGDHATARMGANLYRSLLGGYTKEENISHINIWDKKTQTDVLSEYIKRMKHPLFAVKDGIYGVTAATIASAAEMPLHFMWPRKSLPGLMVDTHAEFARDVIEKQTDTGAKVRIGKIVHMGNTENCEVNISLQELSKHMFISGTTGCGKSNFCYNLLNRMMENNIKFLVVEPAKGEYASVFGGRNNVNVYGTNKHFSPVLAINPFAFPENIDVLEHMDRIIEVFNASWPMYAAMPAILKEALEKAYEACGWDLKDSICIHSIPKFPTFRDLLSTLPAVIKNSEYSQEVQGNYIGSLVTRVKSMTNGICGQIFCEDEIDDARLFDENTIIDISRLGSSETKALIMGILIIRLQEYRLSTRTGMNQNLKHISLLEEAHHLLRAASNEQSMEGTNLRGMSVEILTNAIAEMRSYGESFIIADQSPSIMDKSVIRNTNTKVIFKLPEENDRMAVGRAISLNSAQISEIARLDTGIAVIHQGSWINPVLCRIDYYEPTKYKPLEYAMPAVSHTQLMKDRGLALELILSNRIKKNIAQNQVYTDCMDSLSKSRNIADKKIAAVLKEYLSKGELDQWANFGIQCKWVDELFNGGPLFAENMDNLEEWHKKADTYVRTFATLDTETVNAVIGMFIMRRDGGNSKIHQFYFKWFAYVRNAKNVE